MPSAPSERPSPVLLDARSDLAFQLPRVRTLEADRDVRDRQHAVEVDEDRDQALVSLALEQHAPEQARLAVLARAIEADVVPADGRRQQLTRLGVAIDDLVRRNGVRVHEGVDVRDHRCQRVAPIGT